MKSTVCLHNLLFTFHHLISCLFTFLSVRQVFISQSNDVFTNLALEDWLYRHHDFAHKHLLLLWRNQPCVVIGRHQNPWMESNVPFLRENNINLARRNRYVNISQLVPARVQTNSFGHASNIQIMKDVSM